MTGVALLVGGAAVGLGIARGLGLPGIPLLLLAGIVLNAAGLVPAELVDDAVLLGLTFLVFVAGLELHPRRVGAERRAALWVGLAQFTALGVAGLVVARLVGFDWTTTWYLAVALAASSTLVVVRILKQRRQLFEPFGRLVIGVLLLQDVLVILLIPVLTRLPVGLGAMLWGLLGTLGLIVAAFVCQQRVMPAVVRALEEDEESLLLVVLAFLFAFIGLAHALDLPIVVGAFLSGVALSAFPVNGLVRAQLNSLSDFFGAVFFTALGGLLSAPTVAELWQAAVLVAVVLVLTPPLVTVVSERAGLSARSAIEAGFLVAQTSEFSLVVGLQGLVLGQIAPGVVTVIALTLGFTMLLTPLLATDEVARRLMRFHPLSHRLHLGTRPEGHVLLVGCGTSGFALLEMLVILGQRVVVIDDDPAVIDRLREAEVPCVRGDGSHQSVLEAAGARRARVIVSTMRRTRDHAALLRYAPHVPTVVRVFEPAEGEEVRRLGGRPVVLADAAAEAFMSWYAGRSDRRSPVF